MLKYEKELKKFYILNSNNAYKPNLFLLFMVQLKSNQMSPSRLKLTLKPKQAELSLEEKVDKEIKALLKIRTYNNSIYTLNGSLDDGKILEFYWTRRDRTGKEENIGADIVCVSLKYYEKLEKEGKFPAINEIKKREGFGGVGGILLYAQDKELRVSSSVTKVEQLSKYTPKELRSLMEFLNVGVVNAENNDLL
jgi:hypothetical protein